MESGYDIPVIDIRPTNSHASQQLLDAATKYGFVFVENNDTGIEPADIAQMFELSRTFFALPNEVKEQCSISSSEAGKNHGWLSRGVEKLDPASQKRPDVKEAFNMGEPVDGKLQQPVPDALHQQTLIDFQYKCHRLCDDVLRHFAIALGIDSDWFTSRHGQGKGQSGSILRLLYYPQVEGLEDGVDIRAGAHSDFGSLTLLFQQAGQPGLEIKTASGEWAAVPIDPLQHGSAETKGRSLPILVNIGDLLDDWTANLLKSTVHRVIFPKGVSGDRYSIAYFLHPLDDALLQPVPSALVEEHAAKANKQPAVDGILITAKDHLMKRLATTYTVSKLAD